MIPETNFALTHLFWAIWFWVGVMYSVVFAIICYLIFKLAVSGLKIKSSFVVTQFSQKWRSKGITNLSNLEYTPARFEYKPLFASIFFSCILYHFLYWVVSIHTYPLQTVQLCTFYKFESQFCKLSITVGQHGRAVWRRAVPIPNPSLNFVWIKMEILKNKTCFKTCGTNSWFFPGAFKRY